MGCGNSQIRDPEPISQDLRPLPKGFASHIQSKVEKIEQQKLAPNEDVKNFLSYFLNNEIYFSMISQDEKLCFKYHGLIENGTKKLLDCLIDYIKSNFIYAVSIVKILSFFSLILFRYYLGFDLPSNTSIKQEQSITEKRFQDVNEFKELQQKIEKIEKFIEVEKDKDPLRNTIEFYLFFIKSAIEVTPTNSKEGQEILKEFGSALFESATGFTIKKELIVSMAKGMRYLYNKYDISQQRSKYLIMFNLYKVKLQIINMIEKSNDSTDLDTIMDPLIQVYTDVIKQSKEWEIWCCWIQTLSDIIQYKQIEEISKIDTSEMKQILYPIIHQINEEEYVYEINWESLSKDNQVKQLLEGTSWFHVACVVQKTLINGNQQIQGLEQIYALKIKQEENEKPFSTSIIIKLTNFINHIREVQQEYLKQQEIKQIKEQKQKEQKVKEQIQQIKNLIKKIIQLELQLQQLKIWSQIINYDQLTPIDPPAKKKIKQFIEKVQEYEKILKDNYNDIFGQTNIENIKNQLIQSEKLQENTNIQNSKKGNDQQITLIIMIIMESCSLLRMNIHLLLNNFIELNKILFHIESQTQSSIYQIESYKTQFFDYQLQIQCLELLLELIQKMNTSGNIQYKNKRVQYTIETVTIKKLQIFNYQQNQLKSLILKNRSELIIHKAILTYCLENTQEMNLWFSNLLNGFKKMNEISESSNLTFNKEQDLEILDIFSKFQNFIDIFDHITEKKSIEMKQQIEEFCLVLTQLKQVLKQKQNNFSFQTSEVLQLEIQQKQIQKEKQEILELMKRLEDIQNGLEVLAEIQNNSEEKKIIIKGFIGTIKNQLADILEMTKRLTKQAETTKQKLKSFQYLIDQVPIQQIKSLSESINENLKKVDVIVIDKRDLENLQKFQNNNDFQIDNYQSLLKQKQEDHIQKLEQLQFILNDTKLATEVENLIGNQYDKDLESKIFFILTQLESSGECQEQQNKFDKYKQKASDYFDNNSWRIRQTIVYSLIQIQNRCLRQETAIIVQSLLVKLNILETDNRVKSLFLDQKMVAELANLTLQYWPTQQESIQKIIKQKVNSLDYLSLEMASETQSERKLVLTKQFNKTQQEINMQIKNLENLSSLGITVLFLQDLKNHLVRIENKLQHLQLSVDEIGQNIKFLIGRPFIDLLEIRMKKVFEQALIMNADKVYVPIKTKEKDIQKESENKETNLFTDGIIGDGEIDEFLWQQQKDCLLIHGLAGSGKSTAARKIEEFLWNMYLKQKESTDIIPIIPIFISLPQLKDPLYSAVQETLESDNYRFIDRQVREFKDAVEQGKYRVIFIMDSYDELKHNFIGNNLNMSNKLKLWRQSIDENQYPKIITTSRSELFTVKNYHSWFLSESSDIKYYKEIRLIKFNKSQIQMYLEQYYQLCQKRIYREYSDTKNFIQFEKIWNQWKNNKNNEQIINSQDIYQVQYQLDLLWSPEKYNQNIEMMKIEQFLETPFMMEIVVAVLPTLVSKNRSRIQIKDQFIKKYPEDESIALTVWQNLNDPNNNKFWSEYFQSQTQYEMERVITKYFNKIDKFDQLCKALILEPLTAFDFYHQFFEIYFSKGIQKLRDNGEIVDQSNLWDYCQTLALKLTINNQVSVSYQQSRKLFKNQQSDWRDEYFSEFGENAQILEKIRKCIPLRQQNNLYSFNHKSLQEFLVAKWFIENINQIERLDEFNQIRWQSEFLQGTTNFIADKLQYHQIGQQKLFSLIKMSENNKQNDIKCSSDSIYILKRMNYCFQYADLSNIILQDVDLSDMNFYHANLTNSEFQNVNISYCNFSMANLTSVKWENIKLNELPEFQFGSSHFVWFFDENIILILYGKHTFRCFSSHNFQEINSHIFSNFQQKCTGFIQLSIQQNQDIFAFIDEYIIHIYNMKDREKILEIDCKEEVQKNLQILNILCFHNQKLFIGLQDGLYFIDTSIVNHFLESACLQDGQKNQDNINREKVIKLKNIGQKILEGSVTKIKKSQLMVIIIDENLIIFNSEENKIIDSYNPKLKEIQAIDAFNSLIVIAGSRPDSQEVSITVHNQNNLQNFRQLPIQKEHEEIQQLIIIQNGQQLIQQSDYTIILWSLQQLNKLNQINFSQIECLAAHQNSQIICTLSDRRVSLWDISQTTTPPNIQPHDVTCCTFSYNNKYMATGSQGQKSIKIWDLNNGKQLGNDIVLNRINGLEFSADSMSLYSSTSKGFIYQWDVATQKELKFIYNYNDDIIQMQAIQGDWLLTIQQNNQLKLWKFQNEKFYLISHSNIIIEIQNNDQQLNYDLSKKYQQNSDILHKFEKQITAISSTSSYSCEIGTDNGQIIHFDSENLEYLNNRYIRNLEYYKCKTSKIVKLFKFESFSIIVGIFAIIKVTHDVGDKFIKNYESRQIQDLIIQDETLIILLQSEQEQIIECLHQKELEYKWSFDISEYEKLCCLDYYQDILYLGGELGNIIAFDPFNKKLIYKFQVHQSRITQIKYIIEINQVLTVSEDATIKLSTKDQIHKSEKEHQNKPILYLQISKDQSKIIIGTTKSISLYFLKDLAYFESYNSYENLSALHVNFENFLVFAADQGQLKQSYLSIKKIMRELQNQTNSYFTSLAYNAGLVYIGDIEGRINYWHENEKSQLKYFQTEDKEKILQIEIRDSQILIRNTKNIKIYKLDNGGKINNNENFIFELEYVYNKQSSYFCQTNFFGIEDIIIADGHNIEIKNIKNESLKITRSECKLQINQSFLALYRGDVLVYNLKDQSLLYNISKEQKLSCENTIITNAKIISERKIDLTLIFEQRSKNKIFEKK